MASSDPSLLQAISHIYSTRVMNEAEKSIGDREYSRTSRIGIDATKMQERGLYLPHLVTPNQNRSTAGRNTEGSDGLNIPVEVDATGREVILEGRVSNVVIVFYPQSYLYELHSSYPNRQTAHVNQSRAPPTFWYLTARLNQLTFPHLNPRNPLLYHGLSTEQRVKGGSDLFRWRDKALRRSALQVGRAFIPQWR
jgi:hypothetical protein